MHEVPCKKTQHATSLKNAMSFPRFFQRNPTLQNMKIFCIFPKKKLKDIQPLPNMKAT
jgi:hypothetical protein